MTSFAICCCIWQPKIDKKFMAPLNYEYWRQQTSSYKCCEKAFFLKHMVWPFYIYKTAILKWAWNKLHCKIFLVYGYSTYNHKPYSGSSCIYRHLLKWGLRALSHLHLSLLFVKIWLWASKIKRVEEFSAWLTNQTPHIIVAITHSYSRIRCKKFRARRRTRNVCECAERESLADKTCGDNFSFCK